MHDSGPLKTLTNSLTAAVDFVLPPRCIVTGEIVGQQGMVAPSVWRDLTFIGKPQCGCCGIPFEFGMAAGTLCVRCIEKRPPYRTARSALVYNDASRAMILRFKHADQLHAVHAFTPWLRRAGAEMLDGADLLVPVPLHPFRLWRRRYNQAALIAQALGKSCGLPVMPEALKRQRATPSQGYLDYKQRQKNVKNAFAVNHQAVQRLDGRSVVLIDDVYTTGATVKECTRALLAAGAAAVDILTVARVVKPT